MAATQNVDVANQAYPPPPPASQALPVPSPFFVPGQAVRPASFSQGTAQAATPATNVATQLLTRFPVAEFIVTEGGNFQSNQTSTSIQRFTCTAVDAISGSRYRITFAGVNFFSYGVDLVGREASFPESASPTSPEDVPTRIILAYSTNQIIVSTTDTQGAAFPVAPTATDLIDVPVQREGDEVSTDLFATESNVFLPNVVVPPIAQTSPAAASDRSTQTGTFTAGSGVVSPFVGSGVRTTPFVGTFDVEDQSLVRGLPINVFP